MVIGKHNFIAHALAQRIAEELGDAMVYPTMPYAVAGNPIARTGHMRFPGTVTLPPEVFFGVVKGAAQSALTAGFKVVALMGEHGGGQDELALAAKELDAQARPDGARVLFIGDLYAEIESPDAGHSREARTADERGSRGHSRHLVAALPAGAAGAVGPPGQDRFGGCENRRSGHPQFATAELGKVYLDLKVDLAVKQIRSLLASGK